LNSNQNVELLNKNELHLNKLMEGIYIFDILKDLIVNFFDSLKDLIVNLLNLIS